MRESLSDDKLIKRFCYCFVLLVLIFTIITVVSYYCFPSGILINKQSANFELSESIAINFISIVGWNMISIICIFIASFFSKKRSTERKFISVGYTVLFSLVVINAVTLGTWSFSVYRPEVSLFNRILGFFNVFNNSGLVEMLGQTLIVCSLANMSVIRVCNRKVEMRKFKGYRFTISEKISILIGLLLVLLGALIESIAIQNGI